MPTALKVTNMTDHLLQDAFINMDAHFRAGVLDYQLGYRDHYRTCQDTLAVTRERHGLARARVELLTLTAANKKFADSTRPIVGLTLQHFRVRMPDGRTVNLCPKAGICTKGCVLNNGNGAYPTVQRSRDSKTTFLYEQPEQFAYMLGWELARQVHKHPQGVDFRPNTNSDVEWEKLLPSLLDGTMFGNSLWAYGYTKNESVLDTNGWVCSHYRVAFSANERIGIGDPRVRAFLKRGGSVAVVTNRQPDWRTKQQVKQWDLGFKVADASADDSWLWEPHTIGDLAAKGKLRRYINKTLFIHHVY